VNVLRPLITAGGILGFWQLGVWASGVPPYMLPGPVAVATVAWQRRDLLAVHAGTTLTEIVLGFGLGSLIGMLAALLLVLSAPARRWLMPVLVISQALPVFALAPLLVLWLGYGLVSKVAMAILIIFFPVTLAFFDGLRRTETGWLELARVMDAGALAVLWQVRVPASLPALASGLRVAAAVAPIGAVVGEWVGSSGGLGFLMLQANARMQVDVMFAALVILAAMAVGLWWLVDRTMARLVRWQPDTYENNR
jgi:putative hydroxymethylpyrimidine transport system permease protein